MDNIKIYTEAKIINKENIEFKDNIIIDDFSFIYAKKRIRIGNNVHIACFSSVIASEEEIIFEDFSTISQGVRLFTATDDFKDGGLCNSTIPKEFRNLKSGKIILKRFSIIGANSVVLPGVIIGEGVSVGANSVVTRDLEDWGIYIGNKRIGERNKEKVLENYKNYENFKNKVSNKYPKNYLKNFPLILYDNGFPMDLPYVSSGVMVDNISKLLIDSYFLDESYKQRCIKITYNNFDEKGWAGVVWHNPANDWGDKPGGHDLTGAQKLIIEARGETGEELVEFYVGGGTKHNAKYPDTTKVCSGRIKLNKQWTEYSIDLTGQDLTRIKTGFQWVTGWSNKPVTFYLNNIKYV